MASEKWTVNVKTLVGKTIVLPATPSSKIQDLKKELRTKESIERHSEVLLLLNGKPLEDGNTLEELSLQNGAVLYMLIGARDPSKIPGGPMEIVFSFDATFSMTDCIEEVKRKVQETIQKLFEDIPGLKIAVIAHGDYRSPDFVTQSVDFTSDQDKLIQFVKGVQPTAGWDIDECYELVLYEVRTKLNWTPGTQRSLVMIGDCNPHGPDYDLNTLKLDWTVEAKKLATEKQVKIYAVQCLDWDGIGHFYSELARLTGGKHLRLEQFQNVVDMLMAICYGENIGLKSA